jgi:hypothetical protein
MRTLLLGVACRRPSQVRPEQTMLCCCAVC